MNLAMTFKDFLHIQNYFKNEEKRDPSITEIRVLDTYWSDHCRHTTFATELKNVTFTDGDYRKPIEDTYNQYLSDHQALYKGRDDKFVCLMDLAVLGMKKLRAEGKLGGSGGIRGNQRLLHRSARWKSTERPRSGWLILRMRLITIRRRSSPSAARLPASVARSVTRCPAVLTFIRQCGLREPQIRRNP